VLGYPLAMPILGGTIDRYAQLAALYRRGWAEAGHPVAEIRIAAFSHLHVTEMSVRDDFFPYYSAYLAPLFKGPMPREAFEQMLSTQGTLVAGSVDEVTAKLGRMIEQIGLTRYFGQIDIGGQSIAAVTRGVELFGRVARTLTTAPS
jgi:hypothetical protein